MKVASTRGQLPHFHITETADRRTLRAEGTPHHEELHRCVQVGSTHAPAR
jgi:hypothetical protein